MNEDGFPNSDEIVNSTSISESQSNTSRPAPVSSSRGAVTRRDILVGGATSLVAGPLAASDLKRPYLDVAYEDRTRRGLIFVWADPALPKDRRAEWILRASTFTDPYLPYGRGRFTLRRTQAGWRADIPKCALPGGYEFALSVEVKWDPIADHVAKPPTLALILRRDPEISLKVDDLVTFLKAEKNTKIDEIGGMLAKQPTTALVQALFGPAFDASKASDVQLAFHHGSYWILRAGKKLPKGAVETAAAKQNRFNALTDEGASLRFKETVFTVFSGSKGDEAADPFLLDQKSKEKQKEDVRALFSGDGAPPAPEEVVSKPTSDEAAARSARAPLSEEDRRLGPRVLYALVRHEAPLSNTDPDVWSGTISLGSRPSGERATLSLHDTPPDEEKLRTSFLGWRNAGDKNPVFALRTGMTLAVRRDRGSNTVPSQFDDLNGALWRAKATDKTMRVVASLTPTRRKMTVETRFGPFTAAPLPLMAPRSGVSARIPPIRIGGTGPANSRALNHFAAQLALEHAAIPLRSERLARLAAAGAVAESPAERAAKLFSQLNFNEVECLFRIEGLPLRHSWAGDLPPATDPPQAEAVVHIGATREESLPARLSLRRATLLVRRPADLLALKYRFQDLVLEFGKNGWWIRPDRRIAAFVPDAQPLPDPGVPPVCLDKPPLANEPTRYQSRQDPRPLLVVEFPPQHIAERAFVRRLAAEPVLPAPPAGKEPSETDADILRTAKLDVRLAKRKTIETEQLQDLPVDHDFRVFHDQFPGAVSEANTDGANIPKDQDIYIGPAFLDLEAMRVARKLARLLAAKKAKQEDQGGTSLDTASKRAQALRVLPEVELPLSITFSLRKDFDIRKDVSEGYPEPGKPASPPTVPDKRDKYLIAREERRDLLDPGYKRFKAFYALGRADRAKVRGLSPQQKKAIEDSDVPTPYHGRRSMIARVEEIEKNSGSAAAIAAVQAIVATVEAFDLEDLKEEPVEPFDIPAEARASGPSRLVFRIPADDFETGRPDRSDGEPAGAFPFTVEALTNWGAYDLAVVRRAEKVFEPLAGWTPRPVKDSTSDRTLFGKSGGNGTANGRQNAPEDIPNGRLPPRWARQETRDEAMKLLHQGLTRGDAWAVRFDEQRQVSGVTNCPRPLARRGAVTGPQRMAEVAASVGPASLFETSIELPFRLMLSPAQDAAWRTPLGLPSDLKLARGQGDMARPGPPIPLWYTQLDEAPGSSSVRAIWSPDFRPEALLDRDVGHPPHGPWAPWAMPRSVTARDPYKSDEDVLPLPGQGDKPPTKPPERFRTGLDVADRHELVALSSLHGLPARGRRKEDGTLADGSQINPPPGFKLRHAEIEALKPGQVQDDYSAIYRPQPFGVEELTLTALGGSLDADTSFVPPASAKIVPVLEWDPGNPKPGKNLFDAFAIERWRQNTRLGRDIRVEVVYKGFLFPFGHRASLVKLTERRFVAASVGLDAGPLAFLVQRFFLRIGTPIKTYPSLAQPNGGRRWPVERLEILTRVTPDILDPADATPAEPDKKWYEAPNGRIFLREAANGSILPGLVFWPRVRAREGGEVNFELQIDAQGARTRLPLIFVDNTAANDEATMRVLADEYNLLGTDDDPNPRRIMQLGGGKRRYAPEKEPDGTSFETRQWVIEAEGRESQLPTIEDDDRRITFVNRNFDFGALLQGVDQPPFYPVMARADVRIAQVDRIVGRPTDEIKVFFDPEYRAFGFPKDERLRAPANDTKREAAAKTDVYLDFRTAVMLDPGPAGDRTGGPVRPNTPLVALSRDRGPVGNSNYHVSLKATLSRAALPPASTGLDRPNPAEFFNGASVLGVIDLGKAIAFIGAGLASSPQFREVTQYTSALLTELTDAAGDAGAAVAKVRDRLLIPLREALLTLARQFFEAIDKTNPFSENAALERIERLYPDVGKTYRELRDALDEAIVSSESVRDVEVLLASFATIYGAGRRFLAAIERVANDPLAPVHEALREAFNKEIRELIEKAERILGRVEKDLQELFKEAEIKLRNRVLTLFSNAEPAFSAWRRMVFALPGAHAIPAATETLKKELDGKIEEIFYAAVTDTGRNFLSTLMSQGPAAAAEALGKAFDDRLKTAINAASGDLKAALEAAEKDWAIADAVEGERIKGLVYEAAIGVIHALLKDAKELVASAAEAKFSELLGLVQKVASDALKFVAPLLDQALAAAGDMCGKFVDAILVAFKEFQPPTPAVVMQKNKDLLDAFKDARPKLVPLQLEKVLDEISDPLDSLFKKFLEVANVLDRAATEIAKLDANVCKIENPPNMPRDALAALGALRGTYLAKLREIVASLGSTRGAGNDFQALLAKITGSTTADKDGRKAVVEAARGAATVIGELGRFTIQATALSQIGADPIFHKTKLALENLKATLPGETLKQELTALIAKIDAAATTADGFREKLQQLIKDVDDIVAKTVDTDDAAKAAAYLNELLTAVMKLPAAIEQIQTKIVATLERAVLSGIGSFMLAGEPYLKKIMVIVAEAFGRPVEYLSKLQDELVKVRNGLWQKFQGDKNLNAPSGIGDDLADLTFKKLAALLLVPCPEGVPIPGSPWQCSLAGAAPDNDYLAAENKQLKDLATALTAATPTLDDKTLQAVRDLFILWSAGKSSAQELARRLVEAAAAVLSGDLKRIVDLEGARRRIEEKLKELVPAKIVLNYDLQGDLSPVGEIFLPRAGSQITLSAGAVYNLLEPNVPPRFTAACRLDPFDINLFDVVILLFDGAQFVSESGKGSDFDIVYKDFELGPNAEFLKPLQALMNPGGSGPYVRPSSTVPGIEAGYSLDLGIITIGTLSFANVSINASCILPFNGDDATFSASIGRADRPVLLSCLPYTGGGFLGLFATAKGIIGFEASFEFGGGGAFKFGPLSGQGRISTGIYLRVFKRKVGNDFIDEVTIEGFFYAGGEAQIACFAISATLVVRISHQSGGSMQGSAVFTFSFSLGFAKLRYQVGVQKKMGKGFSGSRNNVVLFAADSPPPKRKLPAATVRCRAKALDEDWVTYQTYFDTSINGFPA
ncbi:hypothetical protein ABIF74_011769 [Bradyrhizobium japonicum]